jgi:hypothetical protein
LFPFRYQYQSVIFKSRHLAAISLNYWHHGGLVRLQMVFVQPKHCATI